MMHTLRLQNFLNKNPWLVLCCFLRTPFFQPFSSHKQGFPQPLNKRSKALRILDLISPKPRPTTGQSHLRIIQDLLQDEPHKLNSDKSNDLLGLSNSSLEKASNFFDEMLEYSDTVGWKDSAGKHLQSRSERVRVDATALCNALSLCGVSRNLRGGLQYHCLAIRTGFVDNVYIGSCLISMYCKCDELGDACNLFDEMPEKNVVTWTAMIAGYAQELQVYSCLEFYRQMRRFSIKPNDFTLTSLLSAFTGSGALGLGRSSHGQIIQMGFESSVHIANALISMYSKCGVIKDALHIFKTMTSRDLVSWNSMIAGYSLHGLVDQAIGLFEEMKKQNVKPDAITFLGVLSSCRHAGLVKQGQLYFKSMVEHGVKPELDHFACIVDLLGRAGLLKEARDFIDRMPIPPNAIIWGSLLSSCRLHRSFWIGIEAAKSRLLLEPQCAATHVQLANLYASVGHWDQAARVRKMMKHSGLKTNPGCSWIEIGNEVHIFRAEDKSNTRVIEILEPLNYLVDHMMNLGYVPEMHKEEIDDTLVATI